MKTIKYMALAMLICCGHSALAMNPQKNVRGMGITKFDIKNATDFHTVLLTIQTPMGRLITPGQIKTTDEFNNFYETLKAGLTSIQTYLGEITNKLLKNQESEFLEAFSLYSSLRHIFNTKYTSVGHTLSYTNENNQKAATQLLSILNTEWNISSANTIKKLGLKVVKTDAIQLNLGGHKYGVPSITYKF